MTMTEHTSGPWEVTLGQSRMEASVWTADHVKCIAQMVRSEDAHLVAAAPEMYAALKALVETIFARPDMQPLLGFQEVEEIRAAQAAIAKATAPTKGNQE